ncbi:RES family NAD+ phosphorylase [Novosphingobium kaempferiae]|uniref:RES family NAD+ phosphorylase n=1 Tax=Novosphingobium kaempferiae TaxID=2896849 RepID=UPI001E3BB860|nr:RES family NAD+ phosphorylase [Novosphingobium kaempferiae]
MAVTLMRRIGEGVHLHRYHRAIHSPIFFGPTGVKPANRFDSPDGSYKTLYAARSIETAFGETFVRVPANPYILSTTIDARVRSVLVTTRTLRLYPLVDAGVSAHGLSFTDLHGDAYARTWEISGHIHATTSADGILYTSRFDNQRCIALFERASDAVAVSAVSAVPVSPSDAERLAAHFGKTYVAA